jgi:hypothetical protein
MRFSSIFTANLAVAILSIALSGLSGPVMSQTAKPTGGANTSLPSVVVEAPKQVARPRMPKHHVAARSTVVLRTSTTTPTPSASPVLARLAQLANATGSCAGGCVTSFRTGDAPWHGCSGSSGMLSQTCRNVGNYKTYAECASAGLVTGWRLTEFTWYCSSLALK